MKESEMKFGRMKISFYLYGKKSNKGYQKKKIQLWNFI